MKNLRPEYIFRAGVGIQMLAGESIGTNADRCIIYYSPASGDDEDSFFDLESRNLGLMRVNYESEL
jgi:hypothetical protein